MTRHVLRAVPAVLAAAALAAVLAVVAGGKSGGSLPATTGPTGARTLVGPWVVRGDRAGRGEALGWAQGGFGGRSVQLPFSPNARHVTGRDGARSFQGSIAWYRTTFTVARAADYAVDFESVNHRATVWIDGRRVARHVGTYLPFEASARLAAGSHRLVVRADWRDPAAMKADAWHRTWFNFGGVNGPVHLRTLGASELDVPAVLTRLRRDGAARVDVTVRVTNRRAARALLVSGKLGDRRLRFDPVALGRGARGTVRARAVVRRPDLWAPGAHGAAPRRRARERVHGPHRAARAALERRAPAHQRQATAPARRVAVARCSRPGRRGARWPRPRWRGSRRARSGAGAPAGR